MISTVSRGAFCRACTGAGVIPSWRRRWPISCSPPGRNRYRQLGHRSWNLVALVHAFPDADIPVVQLAINATKPFEIHLELGAKLGRFAIAACSLSQRQTSVHNLRRIAWEMPDAAFDWARSSAPRSARS